MARKGKIPMELNELREQINQIDDEMARLFAKRMDTVLQVAQSKKESGKPVLDRSRERQVLARVAEQVGEPYEPYSTVLWNVLFDLSRSYQNQMLSQGSPLAQAIESACQNTPPLFPKKATVAVQGVEGAYSQQACDKLFSLPTVLYFNQFEGVFQAVQQGLCQYGILPIENSSAGSVTQVYDLMKRYQFHSVRSIKLKVDHTLLANPGVQLADIRQVVSHDQGIRQCSEWLKQHPEIQVTTMANTAAAAQFVAQSGRRDVAAISSRTCAELYGLQVIGENFQNSDHNYTRFICISKQMEIFPGANKISLMLTLPHKPGSLYSLIARFSALGLNLTKLESRPMPGKDFEFMFYFDFEASCYAPETVNMLGGLARDLESFTFLGSYSEVF